MKVKIYCNNECIAIDNIYQINVCVKNCVINHAVDESCINDVELIFYNVDSYYEYNDTWKCIPRKCISINNNID